MVAWSAVLVVEAGRVVRVRTYISKVEHKGLTDVFRVGLEKREEANITSEQLAWWGCHLPIGGGCRRSRFGG